jgi:hypothetical protein
MITWSYASAAEVDAYYGERPAQTMRAIVIRLDDKPAGIIGVAFEGDRMRAFSEYCPELEPHLKSMPVLRAIKASQRMFAQSAKPVIAVREGCSGVLERLGFVQIDEELFIWPS